MIIAKIAIVIAVLIGLALLVMASRPTKGSQRVCAIDPASDSLNIIGDGACDWSAPPQKRSARVRDIEPRGI